MSNLQPAKATLLFQKCVQNLHDLEKSYADQSKFVNKFKTFLKCLAQCLLEVDSLVKLPRYRPDRTKIVLCLNQLAKTLSLFLTYLHSQQPNKLILWYLCERLRLCLSELGLVLEGSATQNDGDSDGNDTFYCCLSRVLQLLQSRDRTPLKQAIDHLTLSTIVVSSHAFSIDYNEIISTCQKLLMVIDELITEERNGGHPSHLTLLADSLKATLLKLEQNVSNAVLRILVQVLADGHRPLKNLVRTSLTCQVSRQDRIISDLDSLIKVLDRHSERIQLISNFAASYSQENKCEGEIKCCLASLESVDNYLVPAVSAYYLSPECQDQHFIKYLCDHWQDQFKCLTTLLNGVVEPNTFSQVIIDSINEMTAKPEFTKEDTLTMITHSWIAYKQLSRHPNSNLGPGVMNELKKAIIDCETLLYPEDMVTSAVVRGRQRIMSVLDIITEQLINTTTASETCSFSGPASHSFLEDTAEGSQSEEFSEIKGEYYPSSTEIKSDERSIPTVIVNALKRAVKSSDNKLEMSISTAGRETLTFNTTLYVRTPRPVVQSRVIKYSSGLDRSNAAVMDCLTLSLEITNILDNLSSLADTLNSSDTNCSQAQLTAEEPGASGNCGGGYSLSLASVKTEEVSDVNTPQRLQDLKDLDEKIKNLKNQ